MPKATSVACVKLVKCLLSEAYEKAAELHKDFFEDVFCDQYPLFTQLVPHLRIIILADLARWLISETEPAPSTLPLPYKAGLGWLFQLGQSAIENELFSVRDCPDTSDSSQMPVVSLEDLSRGGAAHKVEERDALLAATGGNPAVASPGQLSARLPAKPPVDRPIHVPGLGMVPRSTHRALQRAFAPSPQSSERLRAAVPWWGNRMRRLCLEALAGLGNPGSDALADTPPVAGVLGDLNADDADLSTWLELMRVTESHLSSLSKVDYNLLRHPCTIEDGARLKWTLATAAEANAEFCKRWESDPSCVARATAELRFLSFRGDVLDNPPEESEGNAKLEAEENPGSDLSSPTSRYDGSIVLLHLIDVIASESPVLLVERPIWECARDPEALAAVSEDAYPLLSVLACGVEAEEESREAKRRPLDPIDRACVASCGAVFAGLPVGKRGTRQDAYTVDYLRAQRMLGQYHEALRAAVAVDEEDGLAVAYDSPDARIAAVRSGSVQCAAPVDLDFKGPRDVLRARDLENAPRCDLCEKLSGDGVELFTCSRCKRTRYCSRECQAADWKGHKRLCASWSKGELAPGEALFRDITASRRAKEQ